MSHITSPSDDFVEVTPSDTVDFPQRKLTKAIYVGTTGNVSAVRPDGVAVLFTAVPAGSILPIRCRRINATGTTASTIDALF